MASGGLEMPTIFISHGGGPAFLLPKTHPMFSGMVNAQGLSADSTAARDLKKISSLLPSKPSAILVVSAHWEEDVPTVTSRHLNELFFDYYGFAEETYTYRYPAPGGPVPKITKLLHASGFNSKVDTKRGLDHGAFIPLMLAFPQADIPVLQLSIMRSLDPAAHLALGRALRPLRREGVLILGSGHATHNMGKFFEPEGDSEFASGFDGWLTAVAGRTGEERSKELVRWRKAPYASTAHPRSEHLVPFFVAAGAAEDQPGLKFHSSFAGNNSFSAFLFGAS